MDTKELLKYTSDCIEKGKIEEAIAKYTVIHEVYNQCTETQIMGIVFRVYELEKQLGETFFFSGCKNVDEVISRFEHLKLYLRRLDFNIEFNHIELVKFIKENAISSAAILRVAQLSTVHFKEVISKLAEALLVNQEYLIAFKLLTYLYEEQKDDAVCLKLTRLLFVLEEYETALDILDEVEHVTQEVIQWKQIIQEKCHEDKR